MLDRRLNWVMLGYLGVTLAILGLDWLTKHWATEHLMLHRSQAIWSFFNLTLSYNTGAAFSFLSDAGGWQRWLFTGIAGGFSLFLLGWLVCLQSSQWWLAIALSLILGGALGNLYDRVSLGYVIDFLHFHWRGYHFPVFNLADTAISVGAAMLLIDTLWLEPRHQRRADRIERSG